MTPTPFTGPAQPAPRPVRTASKETDPRRLTPRLAAFTVKGADVQPGDYLFTDRHSAATRVGTMWCGKWPGSAAWDRHSISFRAQGFPFGCHRISPLLDYTVQRGGENAVYAEGWNPQDCDNRRRELETAQPPATPVRPA